VGAWISGLRKSTPTPIETHAKKFAVKDPDLNPTPHFCSAENSSRVRFPMRQTATMQATPLHWLSRLLNGWSSRVTGLAWVREYRPRKPGSNTSPHSHGVVSGWAWMSTTFVSSGCQIRKVLCSRSLQRISTRHPAGCEMFAGVGQPSAMRGNAASDHRHPTNVMSASAKRFQHYPCLSASGQYSHHHGVPHLVQSNETRADGGAGRISTEGRNKTAAQPRARERGEIV